MGTFSFRGNFLSLFEKKSFAKSDWLAAAGAGAQHIFSQERGEMGLGFESLFQGLSIINPKNMNNWV